MLNSKQCIFTIEPPHDETNKVACVPSKDSDQLGYPPSLIRLLAVHFMGSLGPPLFFAGRTGHFVGFVMRRLNSVFLHHTVNFFQGFKFSQVSFHKVTLKS